MSSIAPRVCIIVLNWNGWQDTIECLESVFRICYPDYTVLVVDNGSTDGSVQYIKMWAEGRLDVHTSPAVMLPEFSSPPVNKPVPFRELHCAGPNWVPCSGAEPPPLIILNVGMNLGFSGGNNVGLRYAQKAGYDYDLILNNDLIVAPAFLNGLVDCSKKFPGAGIIGGKVYHYSRPDELQGVGSRIDLRTGDMNLVGSNCRDEGQFDEFMTFSYLGGCCLLIRKEVIDSVGYFDENFFMYSEDVDYCLRTWKEGFECVYTPHSKIWHKWEASSNPGFVRFMTARNKIQLARKHLSRPEFRRFLLRLAIMNIPKLMFGYLKSGKRELIKPYVSGICCALTGSEVIYSNRRTE